LKNKCCLYVIISIRFFSITICNLLIEFPSYLYQSVLLSPIFPVSAFIFLTLPYNIPILFTVIPLYTIISPICCTGYTAFLTTLHSLLVRCATMLLWSIPTKYCMYTSWFIN